jgi:Ran GTPase-activating protein (RanGAP) involved in mRNA processing and transport
VKIKESKPNLRTLCGFTLEETELDMSMQGLKPEDAILLASDIPDMGSLSRLDLSNNEIGAYARDGDGRAPWITASEGSRAIAAIITSTPNLKELNISKIKLQAEGAKIIAPAIEASGSLASLTISNNGIGSEQEAKIKQICAGRSIKCAF